MRSAHRLLDCDVARPFQGRRVLVTGASGFLGWHVAQQGVSGGVDVHTLGRSPGPAGSTFHQADLTDGAAVGVAVAAARPQAIIHCAAPGVTYGAMEFRDMLAVAVNGTEAIYRAAAQLPAPPSVVHVGSGFEYAFSALPVNEEWPIVPSASLYGAAKAAASALAGGFADRLAITIMRPFHIYGAGEGERRLGPHIISQVRAGEPVALTGGEQLRDFIHVGDCSNCLWRALALSLTNPGIRTYNVGSGQSITVRHYIEGLAAALSEAGFHAKLSFGALPYRTHEAMVSLPDTSRWLEVSNGRSQVSLGDGIADLVKTELSR